MKYTSGSGQIRTVFASLLLGLVAAIVPGQQTKPSVPQSKSPDDVVRVSTKLVQTPVNVVDKKGRFVDNLGRDDFEILVDGKRQPISLFEIIKGTTPGRGSGPGGISGTAPSLPPGAEAPGRSVIFFIDDRHLAPDSILRTRKMIEYYIEQQMGSEDQVLIASTSGQIGFLQQFTDSKEALRAAAARLNYRSLTARDTDRPPMSEYQALTIERGDEPMLIHFVSFVWREQFVGMRKVNPAVARGLAERVVHERARRILRQSDIIASATLATLENLTRSVAQLPGRKLVVLVSDGFLQSSQASEVSSKLRDITDAALRGGTVIYSLQGSGLGTVFPDAANWDVLDENGDPGRAPLGEDFAIQAPLYQLAEVTGGHALFNTNDLNGALTRSLDETAHYYLLAWRPDEDLVRERKFHRIKVILKGHPELSARVNRGFFSEDTSVAAAAGRIPETNSPPQEQLHAVIGSVFHTSSLRTNLSVTYMESPAGPKLTILMQVPLDENEPADQKERAADIVGVVLDDQGKVAGSFGDHLTAANATGTGSSAHRRSITYLNQVIVKPGLYQVRVAARDSTSGNIGRSLRWIEVPNVSSGKLSLSSLLLGERDSALATNTDVAKLRAQLKVDNRFNRKARLRMLMYLYNASSAGGSSPQIDIELQLLRQNKVLISTPPRRLEITSDDLREFPFMEELSLATIASGRYVLRVIATDRLGKKSVSREAAFQVE
jgi:VWFA-related protein